MSPDLTKAMSRATATLHPAKSIPATETATPVSTTKQVQTKIYLFTPLPFASRHQIEKWKEKNPDDIHQVPVKPGILERCNAVTIDFLLLDEDEHDQEKA